MAENSKAGKEILLTLAAVVAALLLGEVAVRMILPPPYKVSTRKISRGQGMPRFAVDPEIGWINEPGDETYHFKAAGRYGVTDAVYHMHNGLRDASAAPVPGPVLIATGCSFTYGFGVNDSESWPWLVQDRIPQYRVMNVATSAYGVEQALMRAERLQTQMPGQVKAVIYGFADFHVERDRADQRDLLSLYPTGRPRVLKSGDGVKTEHLVRFWGPGLLLERSNLAMHVVNHLAEVVNKTPGEEDSYEIAVRILKDFSNRFHAKNIAFGVVILPHASDTGPKSTKIRNLMVARLKEAGIPALVPNFPRLANGKIDGRRFLIPSDEFHPNRDYNAILADSVTPFVNNEMLSAQTNR